MTPRVRVLLVLLASLALGCSPAPTTPGPSDSGLSSTTGPTAAAAATPAPSGNPSASPGLDGLVAADLDGVLTTPELAHALPLAVSIDDARVARPQSGFNATSVVWQVPVDGYESRYELVFQELAATDIGPVRSARFFLAHWAAELHAAFAHYGGDALTRAWMRANRGSLFTDVDGITGGGGAYHRIASRPAPHNAYTSSADLRRAATRLGAAAVISAGVHVRPFRDDAPAADRGTTQSIVVPYRTVSVGYTFDAALDAYRRTLDGKAQIDPMDGQPVFARTVVILEMTFRTDSTIEPGHNRPVLGFVGSGVARIFMEGRLTVGRWSKPTENAPTIILGPDGQELPFVRGRIFFQVVPIGTKVTIGS